MPERTDLPADLDAYFETMLPVAIGIVHSRVRDLDADEAHGLALDALCTIVERGDVGRYDPGRGVGFDQYVAQRVGWYVLNERVHAEVDVWSRVDQATLLTEDADDELDELGGPISEDHITPAAPDDPEREALFGTWAEQVLETLDEPCLKRLFAALADAAADEAPGLDAVGRVDLEALSETTGLPPPTCERLIEELARTPGLAGDLGSGMLRVPDQGRRGRVRALVRTAEQNVWAPR